MELCGYSVSSKLKIGWKKFEIAQMWKTEALRKTKWKTTMEAYRPSSHLCCRWHASWIIDPINNYPSAVHLRRTTLTTRSPWYSTEPYSVHSKSMRWEHCNWILSITSRCHWIEHWSSECDSVHKIFPSTKHDMPLHRNGEHSFLVKHKLKKTSSLFHFKRCENTWVFKRKIKRKSNHPRTF